MEEFESVTPKRAKEELKVVFEDNHLLVVIKPQNVPTQEDSSKDLDLLSMCKNYIKQSANKPGEAYCGMVHRLDRPTGGVMVFAKTSKCASRLCEQIKSGEFSKTYLASVVGTPKKEKDRLLCFLLKNGRTNIVEQVPELTEGAKRAELEYEIVERAGKITLVKVDLITGRSHQARVQMAGIGTPIFGDAKYGGDVLAKGHNLALWAYCLEFNHPISKDRLKFVVYPEPEREPWKRFGFVTNKA